jgi:hypothetical protein
MNIDIVDPFYHGYLQKIRSGSVVENLMESGDKLSDLVQTVSEEKSMYRYAEDKWTIKEMIQHLNDAERIFTYRALRFSRNDSQDLLGFEEAEYAANSFANDRKITGLLNEFHILRASSIDLFSNFNNHVLNRRGTANGSEFTVEMIGYIISGHCLHHIDILKERYLNGD